MTNPGPAHTVTLKGLIDSFQLSQAIHVAAVLDLPDQLATGARTAEELARVTETEPQALYRLLRALAAGGVTHEDADHRFSLTPVGEGLRADAPDSLADWAVFIGEEYFWQAWGQLLHSVRTGESAVHHLVGDPWAYRAQHPAVGATFDRAMTSVSRSVGAAVLAAYDFSRFGTVVDVAGGQGAFLAAILAANPQMRGVLFDQPHVVARATPVLERVGVADRCSVEGGSFFDGVPAGGDAYLLKSILHDWYDPEATAILRRVREAMPASGVLLIVEREVAGPNEGLLAKLSDLNMLVGPGGRERTRAEFATLFAAAGFRLTGVTTSAVGFCVFEGIPEARP